VTFEGSYPNTDKLEIGTRAWKSRWKAAPERVKAPWIVVVYVRVGGVPERVVLFGSTAQSRW